MFASGQTVAGRYRIVREIGHGGYGRVYLAEELERGPSPGSGAVTLPLELHSPRVLRQVALKTFGGPSSRDGKLPASLREEMRAELHALCRLSHPNIVAVYDYRLDDPVFIAMELVNGRDLQSLLDNEGSLSPADAIDVVRQIGQALAHAHKSGVLHRDVKPSNVIVSESAHAKLVDFGLARAFEQLGRQTTRVGTPGFVAPELLDPERFRAPIGVAVDVYGLGCLLGTLLAGRSPFTGDTPVQTLRHQLRGERRPASGIPPGLAGVVERATALEPDQRYPSVPALIEVLDRLAVDVSGAVTPSDEGPRHELIDAQVLKLAPFDHNRRGPGLKFELALAGADTVQRGFVYRGASGGPTHPLFDDLGGAWPGAEISLYGAREIASANKGVFVTGDGETLPVLEPHFLVPVTDVVRSQGVRARDCATRPFVDVRAGRDSSRPLLLGRLLHTLLDRLVDVGARDAAFDELFEAALAESRVSAVAAGLTDLDLPGLRRECKASFDWLQRFVAAQVDGAGHSAEVTRYSGRYGLEGRIDLALLTADQLDIIELKSGKHQSPEHEAQLRCYTLLWDHAAEAIDRAVRGRLLYCKAGLEKAVARQDHERERRIVRSRNQVVAAHHALARGQVETGLPHYNQFPERCRDAPCRFRRELCREQSANLGLGEWADARASSVGQGPWRGVPPDLVEAARRHYRHFARLVELEYVVASRDQGAFTRPGGLRRRVEARTALAGARLAEWDAQLPAVRLLIDGAHRLVPGKDVILHRGDPDLAPTLVGRVERIESDGLVIKCAGAGMCDALPRDDWFVEPLPSRIGRREAHRALYALLTERDPRRLAAILFGQPARGGRTARESDLPDASELESPSSARGQRLNGPQDEAVRLAVTEPERPVLIHGPPGTGKTTVIAAAVQRLVAAGQRVLVAAGTNTAVDNVLAHLLHHDVDFLRLGYLPASSPLLARHGREALTPKIERWLGRHTTSLDELANRLRDIRVVAGTAHRCIRSPAIEALRRFAPERGRSSGSETTPGGPPVPFDVAIVDEATQLTEPLTLGVVLQARRFVLVGDARQLPPVLTADEARTAYIARGLGDVEQELGLGGLDRTLFERLAGRAPEATLKVQYRMSAAIQELSNRLYYGGTLRPADSAAGRRLALDEAELDRLEPAVRERLDPDTPIVWETLVGGVSGRRNPAEADAVAETIAGLAELWAPDQLRRVGVISPFRAQCHAIRRGLADRLGRDVASRVEVDTVERFQGREKEVMLVSLVVSTWSDFVMDDRRLNVAFTRARSKLIVFGPAQLLYRFESMLEE